MILPMKLAIDANHRDFYQKNQLIEFEGFLTPAKTSEILLHVENSIKSKISNARIPIQKVLPEQFFDSGRDLWRIDDYLKKIESTSQIPEIVSELVEERPVRLGYDQYYPAIEKPKLLSPQPYHRFLQNAATLSEFSCIDGLLGAFMICLKGDGVPQDLSVFSRTPGNAVFFSPTCPIPFPDLYQRPDHRYLMIVYTELNASYQFNGEVPHSHEFKHLGYGFGDKLNDRWNPIVYR